MPSLGTFIRRRRRAAGLSQEALAELAGVSVRTISNLERDALHHPHADTLECVADALALAPAERERLRAAARAVRRERQAEPPPTSARSTGAKWCTPLPAPPTPLIGRAREVADATALLQGPDPRLLTLSGPPGVGKTRVALAVARQAKLAEVFPDGIVLVDLAPLDDPALVGATIAARLGVAPSGPTRVEDVLTAALHEARALLLLDNFEHVLAAAPLVADVLAACAGLRVLVTSRVALRLRAEQVYPLAPLPLADLNALPPPEQLARVPAIALFLQRAQAVQPHFALTSANAPSVAQLCAALDGLPLALELAATGMRLLSPEQLLAQLRAGSHGRALEALAPGARDLPPRQRTLRDTLAWSYGLLPAPAQRLFRRLAVFAGGGSLSAIHTICMPERPSGADVLAELGLLLDHHLLERRETAAGEPRFGQLETIRAFGRELLIASDEADNLLHAHACFFAALAEIAEQHLTGPDQAIWLRRLDDDYQNFTAALGGLAEHGHLSHAELGLRLVSALWRYWFVRGRLGEGLRWVEHMLALADGDARFASEPALLALRATALHAAGTLARPLGRYTQAVAYYEASLALRRQMGDTPGIAASLNNLAIALRQWGDFARAKALWEECLALRRQLGGARGMATVLNNLGTLAYDRCTYAEATALWEESLRLSGEVGDTGLQAITRNNWAQALCLQGEYEHAERLSRKSLRLYRELNEPEGIALGLNTLAVIHYRRGDAAQAEALGEEGLAVARTLGDPWYMTDLLALLGQVAADGMDAERADALLQEGLTLCRQAGDSQRIAATLVYVARLAARCGEWARAMAHWRESLALFRATPTRIGLHRSGLVPRRAGVGLVQPGAERARGTTARRGGGDSRGHRHPPQHTRADLA